MRGSTLFWFDTNAGVVTPKGSFSFAGKCISVDTKKGLPNTLYVTGGKKLYWFRREQRSELEGFVRALLSSEALVDDAVAALFLQESPAELDVALSATLRAPRAGLLTVVCFKTKHRTTGRWTTLCAQWGVEAAGGASVFVPVLFQSPDPVRVVLYRVAESAKIAIERQDFKSASIEHGGSALVHAAELLHGRSMVLELANKGRVTGNTLTLAMGGRFRDHSRVLLKLRAAGLMPRQQKSAPVFLSFNRLTPDNTYVEMYRTDCCSTNVRDPVWPQTVALDVQQLCQGDYDRPVVISTCGFVPNKPAVLVGQVKTRMGELVLPDRRAFPLRHPEEGDHKQFGTLHIEAIVSLYVNGLHVVSVFLLLWFLL